MNGYVSSAAEEPPSERCETCGLLVCDMCGAPCLEGCSTRRCACDIPCDRWQEALDDAEDAAVDDAKVREAEGS